MEHVVIIVISILIGAVLGIFIGIFIGIGRMQKSIKDQSIGNLRIDRSEPDEPPRPFLEVKGTTIDEISKKKFIVLKIINENYLSRD